MKLLDNKFTETLILLPIIVFFFVSIYYFYTAYVKYSVTSKSLAYSEYIFNLNSLLNENGKEQGVVAIFLGMDGKSDYEKLEEQWRSTDRKINDLNIFLSKYPKYSSSTQNILNAFSTMKDVRSNISVLSVNYSDLYFKESSAKANVLLLENIKSIESKLVNNSIAQFLSVISVIASVKDNAISERAFVSYLLSRSKPIDDTELEVWDYYIGNDITPNYEFLTQNTMLLQLNGLLKSDQFKDIVKKISQERIAIISSINSGNFSTDLTQWYELQSLKIALLDKAQNIIYDFVRADIKTQIKDEQRIMIISSVVFILSLLLVFVVRNIFFGMARDTKQLAEVLKNIDIDSDEEEEICLKGMLERQNKAEIYQFLEKTIRESKNSKRLADEANNTKSKFLANMSHEIRTPLNGIVGFTELLKTTDVNTEQEEFIKVIEKSTENLLAVINDILDLSKIESDKVEIEEIPFDPIVEFESAIESYGAKASEKGIGLGFYIDPNLSNNLRGDPIRIKQILVNLISNAVKFTPEGGKINVIIEKIATVNDKVTVKFSVKDSGIGISQEQKNKIFEAFSQADSSTNRKFGGTGLGLTISKTLVELMDGKLDLESKKGEGTTFFFKLIFEEMPSLEKLKLYNNISVGYYLPSQRKEKQIESYVKEYIDALNKNYYEYDMIDSLLSLDEDQQPELLFIDYDYVSNAELIELSSLKSKISLLTTVHKKVQIDSLGFKLHKVIYSPINFTKIKKVITLLSDGIAPSLKHLKSVDILLSKCTEVETNIFNVLLQKIGYSVDVAKNIEELEIMIQLKNYKHVLLDKNIDGLEKSGFAQTLNEMYIPTLLFVQNMQTVEQSDRDNYTQITLNVANIQLLRHVMAKLTPSKYTEFEITD